MNFLTASEEFEIRLCDQDCSAMTNHMINNSMINYGKLESIVYDQLKKYTRPNRLLTLEIFPKITPVYYFQPNMVESMMRELRKYFRLYCFFERHFDSST